MSVIRLADEIKKVGKFGIVGIAATGVHMLVFSLLLEFTTMSALAANTYSFMSAVTFSFIGNRHWSFAQHSDRRTSLNFSAQKYVAVAICGYLINALFAWLIVTNWTMPYAIALIPMAIITPTLTYLAIRLWVIRK